MARPPVLTPQSTDFPRWYQDVVAKAELAENGPVRGTMVVRPDGYAIWERVQAEVDARIKAAGARNAYFPLLIPETYLRREAEHVAGFSPELAVVTHAGGKELEAPAVVRPTSETVVGEYMARWVQSHRDLPLLLNQWANVVRWELRPRLFLRTTEFLWQEGHTAHATEEEAAVYARRILAEVYADVMTEVLAIPVVPGRKTRRERFAGAVNTLTCEAMMRDGKALQMGTSHELGQNFARAFGIDFLGPDGGRRLAWTTSWGSSTRLLGGLVMSHGDDAGLRLPPRLAPVQVVVLVARAGEGVEAAARTVAGELRAQGVRVEVDDRTDVPFGRRAVDHELKGVPIRIDLGPRDLAQGRASTVRRASGETGTVPLGEVAGWARRALAEDQAALLAEARARLDERTVDAATAEDALAAAQEGWARVPWDRLGTEGEARLAERGVTVRCLVRPDGGLPDGDDEPGALAVVARAY
ncbi:proline--tRNA ligase [Geodermatophilus sp. CPCC 206100]|uniref:proline--tRNA ligase n=1 Tax=Geodermatophilus sp. CPCC 206100 TaxID=3020054 RepID=UPI003B004B3D